MAERYTRVFTAKNNLYALGSPVILSAGALLKDNQTGKILAQLKIRSIANKKIKALTLSVSSFDTSGAALGEDVTFEYLDLSVSRDEEFGQKTLIPLPNASARAFDVTVTKVIFEDNDIWENNQKFALTVSEPTSLTSVLQDDELLEQYAMHFNQTVAKPEKVHDLWYCACGALNHQEEAECPVCGNKLESLLACDFNVLKSERDERLAKEKAEKAAAEEAKRIEREKAAKKTMRVLSIVIPAICAVIAIALVITKVIIPNNKYTAAVALMDDGKYEEAIAAFEAMNGYKDSVEQITACETGIKDDEYEAAVALMNEGKYEEAIKAFEAMNGYRDSADKTELLHKMLLGQKFGGNLRIGDNGDYIITFGTYEQDNDTSDCKEDIEWLVLAKEDNKILVISRYALDCKQYNTKWESVTWETCTLRTWLNETFLNEAFSEAEQSTIQTTEVSADRNPDYSTDPGNATKDKIFLLSIIEPNEYFASDEARMCVPTAYAIANGAWTYGKFEKDGAATCWWWLRSPGFDQITAAYVDRDGGVYSFGNLVYNDRGVRPALWINLDSASGGEAETDNNQDSTPNTTQSDYAAADVGDIIEFGAYEQDNDTSNGKETIEWQVLAKEDNKVLVISKYALDTKPYNTEYEDVTWETCTLRTWLNGTFLDEAFNEAEQSMIQTTEVSADKNPDYSTDAGNATNDKVFLLSINEANKYFASDEARMCVPTAYAIANGACTYNNYKVDGEATCWWWLRSPGRSQSNAARVRSGGVDSYGDYVNGCNYGVRPALWINLDA